MIGNETIEIDLHLFEQLMHAGEVLANVVEALASGRWELNEDKMTRRSWALFSQAVHGHQTWVSLTNQLKNDCYVSAAPFSSLGVMSELRAFREDEIEKTSSKLQPAPSLTNE